MLPDNEEQNGTEIKSNPMWTNVTKKGRGTNEVEREGKSLNRHQHDAEEVETVCQTENRDTEVKVRS